MPVTAVSPNTHVIWSMASRHGPDTSSAVPPSMLPNRGANVSGADREMDRIITLY